MSDCLRDLVFYDDSYYTVMPTSPTWFVRKWFSTPGMPNPAQTNYIEAANVISASADPLDVIKAAIARESWG